jgi:serine/threonine protein kinase
VIIGISIGVFIGVLIAGCALLCFGCRKKRLEKRNSSQRGFALPIRVNGVDSSTIMSDSVSSPPAYANKATNWWGQERQLIPATSGVTKFSYKELHKATHNFTALLGQGAFGPVYKAILPSTGTTLAVKVLAEQSKQGDREFQNEVILLGRLHHRNLVNLVGYCEEKNRRILVYEYMSNGSLESKLTDQKSQPLSWEQRVLIAQDISRGLEYLHEGAVPPVIHRDIKAANILLDATMTARVADFGLSKAAEQQNNNNFISGVKGTFGYVDPEYMSTNTFTEKSDVYSFGVLLFELITARNPQQGLMEYVHMAAVGMESREDWAEIMDSRLTGACNLDELGDMANIAYKCVGAEGRRRPKMRAVAQSLCNLGKKPSREHHVVSMPVIREQSPPPPPRIPIPRGERSKPARSKKDRQNEQALSPQQQHRREALSPPRRHY